jgi:hypothetical protein
MNPNHFKTSRKSFDWLGRGFYFWENNYERALQWAIDKKIRGKIKEPAVIGAVLYLGYCCDLLDQKYIKLLAQYAASLKTKCEETGEKYPQNEDLATDLYKNRILRNLDCDIANHGHSTYKIFDSTRGAFIEGGPAFEGIEIREKTHIQICIRNPNCIKGLFLPRKEIDFAPWKESTTIVSPAA